MEKLSGDDISNPTVRSPPASPTKCASVGVGVAFPSVVEKRERDCLWVSNEILVCGYGSSCPMGAVRHVKELTENLAP